MGNLTIAVDDATVRQARIRAIQEGTSVSAKVREFLAGYAGGAETSLAAAHSIRLPSFKGAGAVHAGVDPGSNRSIEAAMETNEELHARYAAAAANRFRT